MLLISETLLTNLPLIILIWTGITLSWGIYLSTILNTMIKFATIHKGGYRKEDMYCLNCVRAANALLFVYLFATPAFPMPFSDAIIPINIFLNVTFVKYTLDVVRWYHTKTDHLYSKRPSGLPSITT